MTDRNFQKKQIPPTDYHIVPFTFPANGLFQKVGVAYSFSKPLLSPLTGGEGKRGITPHTVLWLFPFGSSPCFCKLQRKVCPIYLSLYASPHTRLVAPARHSQRITKTSFMFPPLFLNRVAIVCAYPVNIAKRSPMLLFEFDTPLFTLNVNKPHFVPLFQFPLT